MNADDDYSMFSVSTSDTERDLPNERPRKRARTSSRTAALTRRILLEEVELEIALQERIARTVQSRITWALLLQQAVDSDLTGSQYATGLQDAAFTALEAIEEPCNVLYHPAIRKSDLIPSIPPTPVTPGPAIPQAGFSEPALPLSTYSTRHRGTRPAARPPPRKLLFLRNHATTPPQIVKLACPDCSRTDFSSLQGILNHCRLSHKREFGSHDECVQCCAVLVEGEDEQAWVVANGAEVGGISLPGLRRLFEIAVGGGQALAPILSTRKAEVVQPGEHTSFARTSAQSQSPTPEPASHLTRTLGHHADSPALAAFLGRETKKRCIHAHGEDQVVDIFEREGTTKPWRKRWHHRNTARAALDEIVEPPPLTDKNDVKDAQQDTVGVAGPVFLPHNLGTRFHIVARVSIMDLSLWIPPNQRPPSRHDCTHRWRIVVASPSYSLPIHTFLDEVIITCLTDPPPPTFTEPMMVGKAPFVATGITDRPFLARVTLKWVGADSLNPPMTMEHWVELDPMNLSNPVLGEEQFFDVELDRATEFRPVTDQVLEAPPWNIVNGDIAMSNEQDTPHGNDGDTSFEDYNGSMTYDPGYVTKLHNLVPQFPLTMKDIRGKLSRQVPYTLVSTPTQLRNVTYGRRKAIEWGRARALQAAYEQQRLEAADDSDIPLTTGDIFHWLEDEGLCLRKPKSGPSLEEASSSTVAVPRSRKAIVKTEDMPSEFYCRFCGLHLHYHTTMLSDSSHQNASIGQAAVTLEPSTTTAMPSKPLPTCTAFCSSTMDPPIMDVHQLLTSQRAHDGISSALFARTETARVASVSEWPSRAFVALADPQLVSAVARSIVKPQHKTHSSDATGMSHDPVTSLVELAKPRNTVEDALAPTAVIALAARTLVRKLVRHGVDAFRRDEAEVHGRGRVRTLRDGQVGRVLTPMHVVRGMLHDAPRVPEAGALLLSLTPLGMSLPSLPEASEGGSYCSGSV